MTIESDIDAIIEQERRLVFKSFDEEMALAIGLDIFEAAKAGNTPVVIDISLWDRRLFFLSMQGIPADNSEWVRRKVNVVRRFRYSSYRFALLNRSGRKKIDDDAGITLLEFAPHGGSFPINVEGAGTIGAITVSGLPMRQDHGLVVAAIARVVGIDPESIALPAE